MPSAMTTSLPTVRHEDTLGSFAVSSGFHTAELKSGVTKELSAIPMNAPVTRRSQFCGM